MIRLQLEAEGFKVVRAGSAEEALVLAPQQTFALITLDIMLPSMDGWELLHRLKQMPTLEGVPVVIISIVADRNKGFAIGASAVMQKPISRLELSDALARLGLIPVPQGRRLKVLVVDDDPKAVELVALFLMELPATVLRAYGGREAIVVARKEQPDLVELDLMMQGVNGFEVVKALNKHPETARTPIVVLSSKQITSEDRARLDSCVAIMGKTTFDRARFMDEVRRVISGSQGAA